MWDGQGETRRHYPRMAEIKEVVARHNGLTVADLESPCRKKALAWPRQIAQYLCREMTPASYPEIGRAFGGRDHTTVLFSFRKLEAMRAASEQLESILEIYRRDIHEAAEIRIAAEDAIRIVPAHLPNKEYDRMKRAALRARARDDARRAAAAVDCASWMMLGSEAEAVS